MLIVIKFFSVPVLSRRVEVSTTSATSERQGNSQLDGQGLAQLGLADSSRSKEQEAGDGSLARV